jgi:hypothetical protein
MVVAFCEAWRESFEASNPYDDEVEFTAELIDHVRAGLQAALKASQ